jgi:Zn-finger nucleic acid-binding protein
VQCPRCGIPLTESQRAGLPIWVCTGCGGVWLDRGELARLRSRLRALEHDWDPDGGPPEIVIRWSRMPRNPRRDPRRRAASVDGYRGVTP